MKFEDELILDYLVKNLESLTEANPVILAKYVVALLKKDKPLKELQKLCADNLVEFLGNGATPFTTKLFQALENGLVLKINSDNQNMEPSQPLTEEIHSVDNISPKQDNLLTSSEHSSDSEDHDISDDNDDDRNHKHRRRGEAEPSSMQNDTQDHFVRKPNKKRNMLYDTVQEFNPASERNDLSKFNTYRSKVAPYAGPRARFIQPARFDLSTSVGRPIGRGRGRGLWNSHDTLPSHANHFVGSNTQNSWGGFGFIPGMANGLMDPLNQLGLQGPLRPTINPPLNMVMPRQRCRDFEERGFCLRGDMCPMEHGLNRIVIEDVQSLSQFNLPVSIPSSHTLGVQNVSGALLPPSNQLASSKSTHNKTIKSGTMVDSLKPKSKLKNIPSTAMGNDADVYDPDQPLWNNDIPSTSAALLRHSSSIEDETSYDVNANSSTWGNISSKNKSDAFKMEHHKESLKGACAFNQNEGVAKMKIGPIASTFDVNKNGKTPLPKALRTLHVYGIPEKNNRKDSLIEHFQKFGTVIDIYVPSNREKAFVQFSKREEAEAALNSPDAVMGNRFIKLSWANRDRIVDSGPSYRQNKFPHPLESKLNFVNGEKKIPSISNHKSSIPASAKTPNVSPAKDLMSNTHSKNPAPVQAKNEKLELLDEIRKKQESLAKKREDFKRQLEEYAKQAVVNKKGHLSEQVAKKQKVGTCGLSLKAPDQVTEKNSGNASKEIFAANNSKINPHTMQRPLKNIYQTSYAPVMLPNRYKLDNRSTSFEIFPLPPDLANVTTIKDHFSCYGVITSVVLGDPDNVENENTGNCGKKSACITFANRQSAEMAYAKGKLWDGHDLNFKWVTANQNHSNSSGGQEISSLSTMAPQSDEAEKTNLQYNQGSDANCSPKLIIKSPKYSPQSSVVKSSCEETKFGSSTPSMIKDDIMDMSAL